MTDETLVERLRRTKTQYRTYGAFGCIGIQDETESREVPVNPDGPEAANRITSLEERERVLREWALEKSSLHHRLAHENPDLRTEHVASSAAYRELAEQITALSSGGKK